APKKRKSVGGKRRRLNPKKTVVKMDKNLSRIVREEVSKQALGKGEVSSSDSLSNTSLLSNNSLDLTVCRAANLTQTDKRKRSLNKREENILVNRSLIYGQASNQNMFFIHFSN
ncbi:hypothetical protein BpHYR1_037324, partial [Brachionus plicatilis]